MKEELISKIVEANGISAGELVLVHFWGEDKDKEIANKFMTAVAAKGASPVLVQQSRTINRDIFSSAAASCYDEKYFRLFENFDVVLDIFAYQPVILGYQIEEEQFLYYRRYMSELFRRLIGCRRFIQIRIPTYENAAESNLNPDDYVQRMMKAYDIDYQEMRISCQKKIADFSGIGEVELHTGKDCILHMNLEGRTWHADAGDGDLPCGEIYIAPVEEKTFGTVYFDTIFIEEKKYTNVVFYVSEGEICNCNIGELAKFFAEQPRENRVVCELGIGMNPNITALCGYSLLDEKMAGTFHIAVGANTMFGGKNEASDHMDMVGHGSVMGATK